MEPITCEKWCEKKGDKAWYEAACLISDIEMSREVIDKVAQHLGHALSSKMYEAGASLAEPHLEKARIPLKHSWLWVAEINSKYECLPEQYTYFAFKQWEQVRGEVREWESMSLWEYLSHWFRRIWHGISYKQKG